MHCQIELLMEALGTCLAKQECIPVGCVHCIDRIPESASWGWGGGSALGVGVCFGGCMLWGVWSGELLSQGGSGPWGEGCLVRGGGGGIPAYTEADPPHEQNE